MQSLSEVDLATTFCEFYANAEEMELVLQQRLSMPESPAAAPEPHPMEARIQLWRDIARAQLVGLQLIANIVYVDEDEDAEPAQQQLPAVPTELLAALPVQRVCHTPSRSKPSAALHSFVGVQIYSLCVIPDAIKQRISSCGGLVDGPSAW